MGDLQKCFNWLVHTNWSSMWITDEMPISHILLNYVFFRTVISTQKALAAYGSNLNWYTILEIAGSMWKYWLLMWFACLCSAYAWYCPHISAVKQEMILKIRSCQRGKTQGGCKSCILLFTYNILHDELHAVGAWWNIYVTVKVYFQC